MDSDRLGDEALSFPEEMARSSEAFVIPRPLHEGASRDRVRDALSSQSPNTPTPTVVFSEDVEHADTHGAALVAREHYLWVADRGRNFIFVVDTEDDEIVNRIDLVGELSDDPTPDLLFPSPQGTRIYMSLRGPNPLTADPHVSTGTTPEAA